MPHTFPRPRPRPAPPRPRYPAHWLSRVVPYAHAVAFVLGYKILPSSGLQIPLDARDDRCLRDGVRGVTMWRITDGLGVGWRMADRWMRWMECDRVLMPVVPGVQTRAIDEGRAQLVIELVVRHRTYNGAAMKDE